MNNMEYREYFDRTELLIGTEKTERLYNASVAVFGIGGVGGYAAEALARCGVGKITLFDSDIIAPSNINRQIIALAHTIGKPKTDVMRDRIMSINPTAKVTANNCFYSAQNAEKYDFSDFDYIIDAIDTVTSKLLIIENAHMAKVPVISCMGTGNKLDPSRFEVSDIYSTSVCPLAKVMRYECKKRNIPPFKVVYSKEPPVKSSIFNEVTNKPIPASISFLPPVAGFLLAGEAVKAIALL